MPIDTYKKEVDTIVKRKLSMPCAKLRKQIKEHDLRHSTLTSPQMPSESSSVVCNETNEY